MMVVDPFFKHLRTRYLEAERAYFVGDQPQVERITTDILHELITLTSSPSSGYPLSTPSPHSCVNDCVCQDTIELLMRSYYHSNQPELIRGSLLKYYGSVDRVPYPLFVVYVESFLSFQLYARLEKDLDAYISTNQPILSTPKLTDLVELLVFHVLCPTKKFAEAISRTYSYNRLDRRTARTWRKFIDVYQVQLETKPTETIQKCTPEDSVTESSLLKEPANPFQFITSPQSISQSPPSLLTKIFNKLASIREKISYQSWIWIFTAIFIIYKYKTLLTFLQRFTNWIHLSQFLSSMQNEFDYLMRFLLSVGFGRLLL